MEGCTSETRTSSSTCGESSPEFVQQDLHMTPATSTEWTDEKHSLYLKSMEASFVNQLYNSIDILHLQSDKEMSDPYLSHQLDSDTPTPSGQLKVFRGGCWKKINFQKADSHVNMANQSHGFLISPWIQHFRSAKQCQVPVQEYQNSNGKKIVSGSTVNCSKHPYLCRCYSCRNASVDTNTEVSDQNFVDENIKGSKTSSTCSSKRMKTQKNRAAINDQVVPYGKRPIAEKTVAAKRDGSHL